jgi:hypothetical protein
MLTHAIVVTQPTKPVTRNELKRAARLKQDLKCRKFSVGDIVIIKEGRHEAYGQILDIITEFDEVTEWNGNEPLNILIYLYDYADEFLYNVSSLKEV